MRVKIFRRGQVLRKKDRTFQNQSFTATHLGLKQHVRVQEGLFKTVGHLVSLPNITLECEVSCLLDVRSSTKLMEEADLADVLSGTAVEHAFKMGSWHTNSNVKPFVEFLTGKSPTMSDLSSRAERCERDKKKRRVPGLGKKQHGKKQCRR